MLARICLLTTLIGLALLGSALAGPGNLASTFNSNQLQAVASLGDTSRLQSFIDRILIPRVSGSHGNRLVRDYIAKTMSNLGWHVELDQFTASTPHGNIPMANVIATFNPNAPRRLVLSAHYDSKYFAPPNEDQFLGATDSAVPVAMLLDIAATLTPLMNRQMMASASGRQSVTVQTKLRETSLQFIFFDGEEAFVEWSDTDSKYGSRHLAQKWATQFVDISYCPLNSVSPKTSDVLNDPITGGEEDADDDQVASEGGLCGNGGGSALRRRVSRIKQIELMVLLDLLGAASPTIKSMSLATTRMFDYLAALERRMIQLNMKTSGSNSPIFITGDLSAVNSVDDDHKPFLTQGTNVLHLIPVPFPQVWHTLDDNRNAIDMPTVNDLNLIMRTFVAAYLDLRVASSRSWFLY
ncbi:hypothetical protein GQ42DRAFT_179093 [Ramicandelaber brevisporus]|nr:hypothetical protein GQ42DRAFT_179093 [Ramicandelaber brevisporus]